MGKEYPTKYWHCYVNKKASKKYSDYHVVNDLTFDELNKMIITPWLSKRPFNISGAIIRSQDEVDEIRIALSEHPQKVYADRHNAEMRAKGIADAATNRSMLPIWEGHDYTFELLFDNVEEPQINEQEDLIYRLCKRLKKSAQLLCNRNRKEKSSYVINDEYDVQDLLQAMLRGYLKYSVTEDPIGKVASTKSARADISIEELGTIIEVKYVHSPSDQKALLKQYSEDILLYTQWAPLKTFIYFIYNSDDLNDGEALEKLSGPQSINGKNFNSKIILG